MFNRIASFGWRTCYRYPLARNHNGNRKPGLCGFKLAAKDVQILAVAGLNGTKPNEPELIFALLCCVFVWLLMWHSRWGYEIRSVGSNPSVQLRRHQHEDGHLDHAYLGHAGGLLWSERISSELPDR